MLGATGNTQYGYLVTVPQTGNYTVTLKSDSHGSTPASTAQSYVNQQPQGGVISIPAPKRTGAVHGHAAGRGFAA